MLINVILLLIVILLLLLFYINYKNNCKNAFRIKFILISSILIILLCLLAIVILPGKTFDLEIYYQIVDRYRLTQNIGTEFSSSNIIFKFFLIFCSYFKDNYWIQFILVFITYFLIALSIYQNISNTSYSLKILLLTFFIQESLMSYIYIYSGARNQIAFGILANCIIYYFFKAKTRKSKIILISGCILATLIHQATFIIILIFLIHELLPVKYHKLLILWPIFIPIVLFLNNFDIPLINELLQKIVLYLDSPITHDIRLFIVNFVYVIFLYFLLIKNSNDRDNINSFLSLFLLFSMSAFFISEIQRRMLIFISYFIYYILYSCKKDIYGYKKYIIIGIIILSIGLHCYHLVDFLSNGATFVFLQ